jgi:ribonuclease HI
VRLEAGNKARIVAYADGSCIGNPGPGGWGVVLIGIGGKTLEFSGAQHATTNNRMEITAAIEALRRLPEGVEVTIRTDSQYVIKTMTRGWKRRENLDLWKILDAETAKRKVHWEWVRGHSGNVLNEKADRLARNAALGKIRNSRPEAVPVLEDLSQPSRRGPTNTRVRGSRDLPDRTDDASQGQESSITDDSIAHEGETSASAQPKLSPPGIAPDPPPGGERLDEREIARRLRPLLRDGEGLRRCSNCGQAFVVNGDPPEGQAYCSLIGCQLKLRSVPQN